MRIRFPPPLRPGDTIAVTAPSAGVAPPLHARLDLVIGHLRARGYDVTEGSCLRANERHVSAPREERAAEFQELMLRDDVAAVFPPWGGEILVEILPVLDWDAISAARPTWLLGFSDLSTYGLAQLMRAGTASAHGLNLMDLAPGQDDRLSAAVLPTLALPAGTTFTQHSSEKWQLTWKDFKEFPDATFDMTEPTRWRVLGAERPVQFGGRLAGGCLDTIGRMTGSPYGDLPAFTREHHDDGVILFFENCELLPPETARTLWGMRLAGWFDGLAGVLIGRSAAEEGEAYSYVDALASALGDLPCPVVYDADIGHRPPQMTLIQGACAVVRYADGAGSVEQTLA